MTLSIDGLASGLDTTGIINQILELERRPISLVTAQIETATQRQTAFVDLSARLLSLQLSTQQLSASETYQAVSVNSGNPDVLAASAAAGVPPGVYTFRTAQLASSSQFVSGGFADADSTAVGAGTLSLELGNGFVDIDTELSALNGGSGVTRGTIRVTDSSGASALVDLSAAITVEDVLNAINDAEGLGVTASVAGDAATSPGRAFVLEDVAGGAGTLTVEEVSGGTTAVELGVLGSAVGTTLEGTNVFSIGGRTLLSSLSDNRGLDGDGTIAADFTITDKTGTSHDIDIDSLSTVQDLIDEIDSVSSGAVALAVNAAGDGFVLTDTTGGGLDLEVADAAGTAGTDLGLTGTTAGASLSGSQVFAEMNDILLSTLNGRSGVTAGSINITDRLGVTTAVDLSAQTTLQGVIRTINASGAAVVASVDGEGNGLQLRDTSGGTGALTVAESGSTTASELGLLGSVTDSILNGTDLNPAYFHENTLLSTLNGGRGVSDGQISITDSNGINFSVTLTNNTDVADVIRDVEGAASAAGSDLTIGINSAGNGLILNSATGSGTLRVDEVNSGTVARDLRIAGTADPATPGTIDGAFEETITISDTDTLNDVLDAIRALDIDVAASVVNDGSTGAPFRLSVISEQTGRAGRIIVDPGGGTNLEFSKTAEARDAVIFFGESTGGAQPLLVRSNTNTFSNVVDGLTVTALQTSSSPVQVTVSENEEAIVETVSDFVARINEVLGEINTLTSFNAETNERGILIGDSTINSLERTLINRITGPLSGITNDITLASQVGIRVVNGRLSFDATEFRDALATNRDAVEALFGASRPLGETTRLEDFRNGAGVRTEGGTDFRISLRDGSTVDVDISSAVTTDDVIDAINAAGGGSVTAALSTTQNSIVLTDTTSGVDSFRVSAQNGSGAASDLGLDRSADASGGATLTSDLIDLSEDVGIAARVTDYINELTDSQTGTLTTRADNFDNQIQDLEDRIETLEGRVASREEVLRRQFAQLEQVISTSESTLARLTAQLGGAG